MPTILSFPPASPGILPSNVRVVILDIDGVAKLADLSQLPFVAGGTLISHLPVFSGTIPTTSKILLNIVDGAGHPRTYTALVAQFPIGTGSGNSILNGSGNPTISQGSVGDFYINTTSLTIFGPKTALGWGIGTSMSGTSTPILGISPVYSAVTGSNVQIGLIGASGSLASVATSGNYNDLSNKPAPGGISATVEGIPPLYAYSTGSNSTVGLSGSFTVVTTLTPLYSYQTGSSTVVGESGSRTIVTTLTPLYSYQTGSSTVVGELPPTGITPVYVYSTGSSPVVGILPNAGLAPVYVYTTGSNVTIGSTALPSVGLPPIYTYTTGSNVAIGSTGSVFVFGAIDPAISAGGRLTAYLNFI